MTDFFGTIRSYLLEYLPNQKCFSLNTIKAHKNALNLFVSFLRDERQMKIVSINFSVLDRQIFIDFLQWLTENRGCSLSSRNQRLSILRTFFGYAGQLDCLQVALELAVKRIPTAREPKTMPVFLSENSLKALLEQPNVAKSNGFRDRFFMVLMYDTAARCSELLDMKVCDLKLNSTHPIAYLRGKGNKVRLVPLMPKTVEYCHQYLKKFHPNTDGTSGEHLFYTTIHEAKNRMTAATVGAFMKIYGNSARSSCPEMPERVHPHQLRHTRAIHLYRDGMPLVLVGEYLGHANPITTKTYAYADAEMKRRVLEKLHKNRNTPQEIKPIWQNDDEMILKLSGLK